MGPSQFRKIFGDDGRARGETRGQGESPGVAQAGLVGLAAVAILASASLVLPKQCSGESPRRERETAPASSEAPTGGDSLPSK